MTDIQKLESDAFRLKDMESLRYLLADLNYEYEDKPVDKQHWSKELKDTVIESRIVARKQNYFIYYIKTNSDSITNWKKVATKIISDNRGFCMVCSHNPSGFQWIFSSISKEFSKLFSETRHIPIEIKPNSGIPKPFLEFLESIKVEDKDKGITVLTKISNAFDKFSLQIQDELTINVFEALKTLSEGLIGDKSNNLILSTKNLEKIREPIFILLYRIIFILYAEDRSIFPIENKIYYGKFSLKWIKNNWILRSYSKQKIEYECQNRLRQLFQLIEVGSEELNYEKEEFFMRSYYGRLFDRKINSDLEKWNIPNQFYIKAIEFVTTTRDKKGNRFFLDYAALDITHLGSIYERLLEFHLTVHDQKIADLPSPKDRKSSGSYYTPKYIVNYIVANSIGSVIDRIIKETPLKSQQIEKILSLNILDTAMGSGHFLVGATQYIAKRICEIESEEIILQNYIERKRDVVRRCIYGVDKNPLAVDLASLSLWLETISSEKPLSFLSAHLKCGNSLMGTKIEEILEKQTTLLESQKGRERFVKNMKDFFIFENLKDDTPNDVRIKTEKFEKMKSKGTIYYDLKFLLDSKLAESLGITVPALGDYRSKIGENSIDFYTYDIGPKIKELSEMYKSFHWELEFSDVFFDEKGNKKSNTGFDIIIGNPPYIQLSIEEKLSETIKKYLLYRYKSSMGRLNTFGFFIYLGIELMSEGGRLGFIVPNTLLTQDYYDKLRNIILNTCIIESIVTFQGLPFKDAVVENIIIILKKVTSANKREENQITIYNLDNQYNFIKQKLIPQSNFIKNNKSTFNIQIDETTTELVQKIRNGSTYLGKFLEVNQAIALKHNRARWVTKDKTKKNIKPLLVGGKNINRYSLRWDGSYLIYNLEGIHSCKTESIFLTKEKIIFRRVSNRLIATLDTKQFYALHTLVIMNSKTGVNNNLKYFLAIFNSKLLTYYYQKVFASTKTIFSEIGARQIKQLPIRITSTEKQEQVIKCVNKMLSLNKKLEELDETKNNQRDIIKQEIKQTDLEIDELIYDIYNITENEKKVIENSIR